MSPSRRTLLSSTAAMVPVLVAGCSATGLRDTPNTETPSQQTSSPENQEAKFEAWLNGPDADRILFNNSDIVSVGAVEQSRTGGYKLPISLSKDSGKDVSETFRNRSVADSADKFEIVLYQNGSAVTQMGISPQLAQKIGEEDWNGKFVMMFEKEKQAVNVRNRLSTN